MKHAVKMERDYKEFKCMNVIESIEAVFTEQAYTMAAGEYTSCFEGNSPAYQTGNSREAASLAWPSYTKEGKRSSLLKEAAFSGKQASFQPEVIVEVFNRDFKFFDQFTFSANH